LKGKRKKTNKLNQQRVKVGKAGRRKKKEGGELDIEEEEGIETGVVIGSGSIIQETSTPEQGVKKGKIWRGRWKKKRKKSKTKMKNLDPIL